jgi:hypothetical protein
MAAAVDAIVVPLPVLLPSVADTAMAAAATAAEIFGAPSTVEVLA